MTIEGRTGGQFEGGDDTPSVGAPERSWVLPMGIAAAIALGGVIFWQLSENRLRIDAQRMTDPAPGTQPIQGLSDVPAPPDISAYGARTQLPAQGPAPPYPGDPPQVLVSEATPPNAPPPAASSQIEARIASPALVVDYSEAGPAPSAAGAPPRSGPAVTAAGVAQSMSPAAGGRALSADEQFAARLGVGDNGRTAVARRIANPSRTLVEGAVIPGVLETALNSDLPGYVRAVVSRDVKSFDGTSVLVPRGSRLIGQYRSGVALGQSRAFVIWTRLIRPDGVSVDIAAPGADALGRGGLRGDVDRHFLQRFGGAILLSLISAGVQLAQDSADTQVIIASTRGAGDAAAVTLQRELDIAPTVSVPQGAPIRIFVTSDLDFSVMDQGR
ncbi:MAG: TrbI/VirB10 family protein [Hyphomonadaceae bacterium]|nr:TrbI/VirB10 family protein [Hyphomonadaceae bacterium]